MTTNEFKVFRHIALLGTATLLERIVPEEKLESEYIRFNKTNAKNFLLLKLLTAVQKTGFVFSRWIRSLETNASSKPISVPFSISSLAGQENR